MIVERGRTLERDQCRASPGMRIPGSRESAATGASSNPTSLTSTPQKVKAKANPDKKNPAPATPPAEVQAAILASPETPSYSKEIRGQLFGIKGAHTEQAKLRWRARADRGGGLG